MIKRPPQMYKNALKITYNKVESDHSGKNASYIKTLKNAPQNGPKNGPKNDLLNRLKNCLKKNTDIQISTQKSVLS